MEDKTGNGRGPNDPIIGICIRYCKNDQPEDVWIDLSTIGGLVWSTKDVDSHSGKPNGTHVLKGDAAGPTSCTTIAAVDTGICWWNGTQWICCD